MVSATGPDPRNAEPASFHETAKYPQNISGLPQVDGLLRLFVTKAILGMWECV